MTDTLHDAARGDAPSPLGALLRRPLRLLLSLGAGALAIVALLAVAGLAFTLRGHVDGHRGAAEAFVFVAPSASDRDSIAVRNAIAAQPGVVEVRYVGRDEALQILARRFAAVGAADPLAELKSNPLPDAYVATFARGVDADGVQNAAVELRKLAHVEGVEVDVDAYRTREAARRVGWTLGAIVAALAAIGWLRCLVAMVDAVATPDADDVRALRLVGADEAFIRAPAVRASAIVGAAAGALAALAAAAGLRALGPALDVCARSYGIDVNGVASATPAFAAVAIAAVVVAAAGVGALVGQLRSAWLVRRVPGP